MTRQQAVDFLLTRPADFAHMIGFTKLGDLHNGWLVDMVRGKDDHTLQASRGVYKTTCVSVALALIIILLPNKRTMFMRKTDTDVKEVIKQVQKILQDPHTQYFVQAIYGVSLRLVSASVTEIVTNLTTDIKGTAQLVGIGTGASLTGKHFDFIFTDDIVNVNDRVSKAERERTKIVYQELQNIKNRGGRIYNTGTPWHIEDAFSIMPPAERFDCYHPEVKKIISDDELEQLKGSMLHSLFAANYELRFVASEDVIFTDPVTGYDPSILDQAKNCHLDAAYGGEDYTAFTIIKKTEGKFYVFGKLWHKHVDDVLDEITAIRQGFNAGRIYCEDNGDKGYLAKELTRRRERVISYHEKMNKFLKITTYLKAEWKNVIFVAGTDEEYIQQICDYTEDAEHDDAPDSLSSLIRLLWDVKESDRPPVRIW
jgi:predicted phage terminase large subunit-like protein